jgi:hypothetical protein
MEPNHRDRTRASTLFSSFEHVKSLLIMGPNNTKNLSLKCDFLTINYKKYCQNLVLILKNTKFDQKTVSLLGVKTKSGAHKQLTFYFQMRKYFCRHLHSSLISMTKSHSTVEEEKEEKEGDERDDHGFLMKFFAIFSLFSIRKKRSSSYRQI